MTNLKEIAATVALSLGTLAISLSPLLAEEPPIQKGGTVVFTLSSDPRALNPVIGAGVPDYLVGCLMFEGLVTTRADFEHIPTLAKSWTASKDGLSYTFELADAVWHDGEPFTAEDVRYSLMEINAKHSTNFGTAVGRVLEDVEVLDIRKVRLKLKEPYGPFLSMLGCGSGASILPAHIYKGTDPRTNPATLEQPVGTGPFKFVEWQRGAFMRFARNPDYREEGKPYLNEMIGKVITQPSSRIQALRAGEVDVVLRISSSDIAVVKQDPNLKIEIGNSSPSLNLLFFNIERKFLKDPRVRHALLMATDRDFIFDSAFFGAGTVGRSPFGKDIPWAANPSVDYNKMYPFDVERANVLLDDAGVARGDDDLRFKLSIVIYSTDYPEFQEVATALKSMWRKIGVDVSITPLDRPSLMKKVFEDRDFDVTVQPNSSYFDPAIGFAKAYTTSTIGKLFGNPSNYSNLELDQLFLLAQRGSTKEERSKYYMAAEEIIARDLPAITLRSYPSIDAASQRLHGVWGYQGANDWSEAWLEK